MSKKKKITGTINDYPLVTIKWRDCLSDNNWMSIKKATRIEPAICHSIGYKLLETSKKVTIFAAYSEDLEEAELEIGNINVIPKSWVLDITEIQIQ